MTTLDFVLKRYNIDKDAQSPVNLEHGRGELGVLFNDLGFDLGAEIGTDLGVFAVALCKYNPKVHLYCIDPWEAYNGYDDITDQKVLDANYLTAKKNLEPYDSVIIRKPSAEAVKDFYPGLLDYVFIDGNHTFDYAMEDINQWSKIVKKGGIVSGHDYKDYAYEDVGVSRAVDSYLKEHGIKQLFLLTKFGQSGWFFINE